MIRILAVVVLGGLSSTAFAGACPSHQLAIVSPAVRTAAPTNTVVRVQFDGPQIEVVELVDETTRQIRKAGVANVASATVSLRTPAGVVIPTTITVDSKIVRPTFELAPRAALAANAAYAIVVTADKVDYVVAHFTTAAAADATAPSLAPITKSGFFTWKQSTPPHWKDSYGSFVELGVAAPDAVGFDVFDHEPAAGDRPISIVANEGTTLHLGAGDTCKQPTLTVPAKAAKLALWIRAFDAANNPSAVRAITVDLRHPRLR